MVTLREVAQAADVSTSTASRAWSHPQAVSTQARAKILAVADSLGYVPGKRASSRRMGNLALVVPDIANPFFPPFIKAAQRHAMLRNFSLFLADTDEDPRNERQILSDLIPQVDGVLLCSSRLTDDEIYRLQREEVRIVLLNRLIGGIPSVLIDTGDGMRQAIDHLAKLGHKSVVYVSGPASSWSDAERQRSIRNRARDHGIELHTFGPYIPDFQAGLNVADSAIAAGATAILTYDDIIALGVITRLADRGVRVPADVSVIGCDDIAAAGMYRPPLTTIHSSFESAATAAIDLLVESVTSPLVHQYDPVIVPSQLVIRATTSTAKD